MEPRVWHAMSEEARRDHVKRLRKFSPTPSSFYSLPSNVGRKPGEKVRKRKTTEPLFVEERIEREVIMPTKVTLKRHSNGNYSSVGHSDFDINKLDPRRKQGKELLLRLKASHKMVTR